MPSNPCPEYNGDRYFVDYEGLMGKHSLQLRFAPGTATSSMASVAANVVTYLRVFAPPTTSFNAARVALHGSGVTLPVTWSALAGVGAAQTDAAHFPQFISFVGRSAAGRRTRLTLHGATLHPDVDYRILQADSTGVAQVLTALRNASPAIVACDFGGILWNSYANTGFNSHFQRKRRVVA